MPELKEAFSLHCINNVIPMFLSTAEHRGEAETMQTKFPEEISLLEQHVRICEDDVRSGVSVSVHDKIKATFQAKLSGVSIEW